MAPEALDACVSLHDLQSFKQIDVYAFALVIWEIIWRCALQEGGCGQWVEPAYIQLVWAVSVGVALMSALVCRQMALSPLGSLEK